MSEPKGALLSNRMYDILKAFVQLVLPATGTLYFALAAIWGLPKADEVVGTLAAVATFLGVILAFGSRSYNNSDAKYDGVLDIQEEDSRKTYTFNVHDDIEDLDSRKEVLIKVDPPTH